MSTEQERERRRKEGLRAIKRGFKGLTKMPKISRRTKRTRVKTIKRISKPPKEAVIHVERAVSWRGRVSLAEAPLIGQPRGAQDILLTSSVMTSYKYRIKTRVLRIWFQSGHVYDYFDVPRMAVEQLGRAPSKGRYFYYNIRTSYKFTRIK